MVTLFDFSGPNETDWRDGTLLARITRQDELGAEHLCVATERAGALEQLAVIHREPASRVTRRNVGAPDPGRSARGASKRTSPLRNARREGHHQERQDQPSAHHPQFRQGQLPPHREETPAPTPWSPLPRRLRLRHPDLSQQTLKVVK